ESAAAAVALCVTPLGARAQIGFAEPLQHVGRKAWPVVADDDLDPFGGPFADDFDPLAREIDGVFDQIFEPVDHAGIAAAARFGPVAVERAIEPDVESPQRLHDLVRQLSYRKLEQ